MAAFDFSVYKWRPDENAESRFKRQVGGGENIEDVWNFIAHGEQNLFLGVYTKLSQSPSKLIDLARKAWISLRWDVPTIASQTLHEPREGSPLPTSLLAYTVASNLAEVEAWANDTVMLKEGVKDLDALRYEVAKAVGMLPVKSLVPQTYLYATQFSSTEFGFLMHSSHVPFDGAGLKIVMSKFLEHLSNYILDPLYADKEAVRFQWGTESGHLLPIASEALRKHEPAEFDTSGNLISPEFPEEPREGPKYDETLGAVMTGLAKGMSVAHPFKSLKEPPYDHKTKPFTRRVGHTYSIDESKKIIAACANAEDRLTVNHLAHGALSLLVVLDNMPEQGSPNVVFYYGLVDSRNRLAKQYRGAAGYPGYCLGMSGIQVPVNLIDKYASDVNSNLKSAILEFAQAVKKEYKQQAEYPSLLAIENQQVDMMLSAPPPPPWKGPWFSGDGRGAVYLRPKYPQDKSPVIEVTDFFVSLNKTDPGPFFRITEWDGRIKLSADYNEMAVDGAVADGWMKKWAELILAFSS